MASPICASGTVIPRREDTPWICSDESMEGTVFFQEIGDDLLLVAIDPAGNHDDEDLQHHSEPWRCDGILAHMEDGFATLAAAASVANHRSIARTDATGTRTSLAPATAGGDRAGGCHFGERDGVATSARLLPTHRDRLSRRTHTARTSTRRTTSRRCIDRTWTMLFSDEPAPTTVTRGSTHGDRLHLR